MGDIKASNPIEVSKEELKMQYYPVSIIDSACRIILAREGNWTK